MAKGVTTNRVMRRHVGPPTFGATVSLAPVTLPLFLTNVMLVERVFSVPGFFHYVWEAIGHNGESAAARPSPVRELVNPPTFAPLPAPVRASTASAGARRPTGASDKRARSECQGWWGPLRRGVDESARRRNIAQSLGAAVTHRARRSTVTHATYDIVVEASSRTAGLRYAIRSTAPGGICTAVGYYIARNTGVPLMHMYANDITLHLGAGHSRAVLPE